MPRVNLSISPELYNLLQKDADSINITVNQLITSTLEEKYFNEKSIDYVALLEKMIEESKEMTGDFVLADLVTYSTVEGLLIETNLNVSTASIKARLGKMYNEAVRKNAVPGVSRAFVEKNGLQELKYISRAAVYTKLVEKTLKKED